MNKNPHALFFNPPITDYFFGHQTSEIWRDNIYAPYLPKEKKGSVCVDIGGNIGVTAYYFSQFFERVIVCEPALEHFEVLTHMINYNHLDNVEPHKLAIHLKDEVLPLSHNKNKTMYSLHTSVDDGSSAPEVVKVIPIDTLFEDNKIEHCNLLKVDIEGSETELFSGPGFKKIAPLVDTIVTERHAWNGRNPNQLDEALKMNGFKVSGVPSSADIVVATRL